MEYTLSADQEGIWITAADNAWLLPLRSTDVEAAGQSVELTAQNPITLSDPLAGSIEELRDLAVSSRSRSRRFAAPTSLGITISDEGAILTYRWRDSLLELHAEGKKFRRHPHKPAWILDPAVRFTAALKKLQAQAGLPPRIIHEPPDELDKLASQAKNLITKGKKLLINGGFPDARV